MLFQVFRTSDKEGKPCDGAQEMSIFRHIDRRAFPSLHEWEKTFPKDFERQIYEKRETAEGCEMVINDPLTIWVIEIDDLESLELFLDAIGSEIIIRDSGLEYEDAPKMTIEIYDDYRE